MIICRQYVKDIFWSVQKRTGCKRNNCWKCGID